MDGLKVLVLGGGWTGSRLCTRGLYGRCATTARSPEKVQAMKDATGLQDVFVFDVVIINILTENIVIFVIIIIVIEVMLQST